MAATKSSLSEVDLAKIRRSAEGRVPAHARHQVRIDGTHGPQLWFADGSAGFGGGTGVYEDEQYSTPCRHASRHLLDMVGARGFEPVIPTCRIVVPGWIAGALAGRG